MTDCALHEISTAVETLSRSERGRQAMNDVFCLLDNGGGSLDERGQEAVLALIVAGFAGRIGSTLDALREALNN